MKRHYSQTRIPNLLLAFALWPASLLAVETPYSDKNYPAGETKEGETAKPNSKFKIDGIMFSGYEFLNHQVNGAPDQAGPTARQTFAGVEPTGFTVNRFYVNFRGEVADGPFKGWGFRFTPDIQRQSATGATFTTNSQGNDYMLITKFAYINIPLFDGGLLRLGQQGNPFIAGDAGVDLDADWGHRYIDQTALEMLGLGTSTDRGLSFLFKSKYFAYHGMIANGEGFHRSNAQNLTSVAAPAAASTANLDFLSQGTGDSYGLTYYHSLSVIPTGDNKEHKVSINLPVKLDNVYGVDAANESRFVAADITTATPTWRMYIGDKKAKQDVTYALQTNYNYNDGNTKLGFGIGQAWKTDRRTDAYIIDNTVAGGIDLSNQATVATHYRHDVDAKGSAKYVYVHARVGSFGGFARLITGTSSDTLSGAMGVKSGRDFVEQSLFLPAFSTTGATPSYYQLKNPSTVAGTANQTAWDPGKATLRFVQYGVTYYVTEAFRVTAGVSYLTGTDRNGQAIQVAATDRVVGNVAQTTTLSSQIAAGTGGANALRGPLGLASTDPINPNWLTGQRVDNKQIYIRTQFVW